MLTRAQQLAVVGKAARAPSPHNIQPARWRFAGHAVQLLEQTARWLSVGDPSGRDNRLSLGMAWEGMSLALAEFGCSLAPPPAVEVAYPPAAQVRPVASAALSAGGVADPLASQLEVRCSYRGTFLPADAATHAAIERCAARYPAVVTLLPQECGASVAQWYDEAAAEGLRNPAFTEELYRWLRFSRRHPDWSRDGLTAQCLALSPAAAFGASWALRPAVVRVLSALGLGRALVSEAGKVRSAAALVLVHAPEGTSDFDAGRAWYRFWLELTAEGLAGVPMSALTDSPRHARILLDACAVPAGSRLINCMRVGRAPNGAIAPSARLPAVELLL